MSGGWFAERALQGGRVLLMGYVGDVAGSAEIVSDVSDVSEVYELFNGVD
jgi:hypothetical protein